MAPASARPRPMKARQMSRPPSPSPAPSPAPDPAAAGAANGAALEGLIACPKCDAVYSCPQVPANARARCLRCHTVLVAPRRRAGKQAIALGLAALILLAAAIFAPFLKVRVAGVTNAASLVDTGLAFAGGPLAAVSLAVLALILAIPALRAGLLIYVLWPLVQDRPAHPRARAAFRLAEELRPWSMAEIFILGCGVALVKVADLAQVTFGPAFWLFAALAVVVVVQDSLICRYSVWKALDPRG